MVEVAEIVDLDSLGAWLQDVPKDKVAEVAVAIGQRAAMRVLPLHWKWVESADFAEKRGLTALLVLRCNLTSKVVRKRPTLELSAAADTAGAAVYTTSAATPASYTATDAAFAAADETYTVASYSADTAARAARLAGRVAARSGIDRVAFYTIDAATRAAANVAIALWKEIRSDCEALQDGGMLLTTPLWDSAVNPFQKEWDAVRTSLSPDWSFWINWYQDALEGREPDWDMLEEIALISDEDWEKGSEHINNEVIARIVDKYAKKEKAGTSAPDTSVPSGAEKKSIAQKVTANREALALSIAGVLEQIKEYRERVRQLNSLDPEYKEGLLDFLDRLSKQLSDLLGELPDEGEVVSEEKSTTLVLWWREYKAIFRGKAKAYLTADNIAEATVPAGIILGCTGIGAIFGPVGATAGGIVGSLITGQIKPGKAAGELMKDLDAPDSGI